VLAECKYVYKDAGDVQRLRLIEALIEEEQGALLEWQEAKAKAKAGDGE
jgi:hypothetical protein